MSTTRSVSEILEDRKATGADCSEDESALLKHYVREYPYDGTSYDIQHLFPVEWDEAQGEEDD